MEEGGAGLAVPGELRRRLPRCQQGSLQPRESFPLFPHVLQQPMLIHFTEFTFTLLTATNPSN